MFINDQTDFDLRELCAHCGHRNGKHNMFNHCPKTNSNGTVIRSEYADTEFKGTGVYEEVE